MTTGYNRCRKCSRIYAPRNEMKGRQCKQCYDSTSDTSDTKTCLYCGAELTMLDDDGVCIRCDKIAAAITMEGG